MSDREGRVINLTGGGRVTYPRGSGRGMKGEMVQFCTWGASRKEKKTVHETECRERGTKENIRSRGTTS